ncbi:MAG: diacylglycerol kinase family protein [Bacillus sp. (in: Bacteria)]|nr:diacylglycerol kinase family protein [Bacillus sp. (in: firmicutes)]
MDLKDKGWSRFIRSFSFAVNGIKLTWEKEQNFRIHVFIAFFVVIVSLFLPLSAIEWALIIFSIFGMLALEMMNTAIERTVDLVTGEYHPLAKMAKDIAAGAVFVYAIMTVIIGLIIILPKLLSKWGL